MAYNGQNLYPEIEGPVDVTRDGEVVAKVSDQNAAFAYILEHQGMSVDWALRYEGWGMRARR